MIGFLIKIAVFAVIGILGYNYFFGTSEEKAQSGKVFGQVKEVAVSVGELAKSEKVKYDAGKYDTALEKLAGAYKTAREGTQKLDKNLLKRIDELEKRRDGLEAEIASIDASEDTLAQSKDPELAQAKQANRKKKLQQELDKLIADSDRVLNQPESKQAR